MAKVNISVDTEDKTLSVDLDGTSLANVNSVSVYRDPSGDYFYIEVTEYEKQDNKISKTTRYSASATEIKQEDNKPFAKAGDQVKLAFTDLFLPKG